MHPKDLISLFSVMLFFFKYSQIINIRHVFQWPIFLDSCRIVIVYQFFIWSMFVCSFVGLSRTFIRIKGLFKLSPWYRQVFLQPVQTGRILSKNVVAATTVCLCWKGGKILYGGNPIRLSHVKLLSRSSCTQLEKLILFVAKVVNMTQKIQFLPILLLCAMPLHYITLQVKQRRDYICSICDGLNIARYIT